MLTCGHADNDWHVTDNPSQNLWLQVVLSIAIEKTDPACTAKQPQSATPSSHGPVPTYHLPPPPTLHLATTPPPRHPPPPTHVERHGFCRAPSEKVVQEGEGRVCVRVCDCVMNIGRGSPKSQLASRSNARSLPPASGLMKNSGTLWDGWRVAGGGWRVAGSGKKGSAHRRQRLAAQL